MEIIDELEPIKRGGYGGAIGYLSYTGDLDTCIHIRTVVMKDGRAHVQAGGGTVADAQPEYEFERVAEQGRGGPAGLRARRRAAGVAVMGVRLVVDNYDSFTYNLVQYLGELGAELDVVRNDVETVDELLARDPDRVLVSPGPVHARRGRRLGRGDAPLPRGGASRPSASAWATRRSPRRSAARSSRASPSTARPRRSSTTAGRSSPACPAA
jgi:hypothetical protein